MLDCVRALGATVDLDGPAATVTGIAGRIAPGGSAFARQSGTTARFIAPVLALAPGPWRLDGDPQLRGRPMDDLFDALRGSAPASCPRSPASPFPSRSPGPSAARWPTSLADLEPVPLRPPPRAPLREEPSTIRLTGELVSRPFVEMTVVVMERFGAKLEVDAGEYRVQPGGYRATAFDVEPDATAASYFFAVAAITGDGCASPASAPHRCRGISASSGFSGLPCWRTHGRELTGWAFCRRPG